LGFRWSKDEAQQKYRLQLSLDLQFKDILHQAVLDEPTMTIKKPASGVYYMRVSTVDTDGYEGPFSTAQEIEVPYDGIMHYLIPVGLLILAL
jgi:hypothetical protein